MPFRRIGQHRSSLVPSKKKTPYWNTEQRRFSFCSPTANEKDLSRHIISSLKAAEILIWVNVPGKNFSLIHLLSVCVKSGDIEASGEYQGATQDSQCYPFGFRP